MKSVERSINLNSAIRGPWRCPCAPCVQGLSGNGTYIRWQLQRQRLLCSVRFLPRGLAPPPARPGRVLLALPRSIRGRVLSPCRLWTLCRRRRWRRLWQRPLRRKGARHRPRLHWRPLHPLHVQTRLGRRVVHPPHPRLRFRRRGGRRQARLRLCRRIRSRKRPLRRPLRDLIGWATRRCGTMQRRHRHVQRQGPGDRLWLQRQPVQPLGPLQPLYRGRCEDIALQVLRICPPRGRGLQARSRRRG